MPGIGVDVELEVAFGDSSDGLEPPESMVRRLKGLNGSERKGLRVLEESFQKVKSVNLNTYPYLWESTEKVVGYASFHAPLDWA